MVGQQAAVLWWDGLGDGEDRLVQLLQPLLKLGAARLVVGCIGGVHFDELGPDQVGVLGGVGDVEPEVGIRVAAALGEAEVEDPLVSRDRVVRQQEHLGAGFALAAIIRWVGVPGRCR